MTAEPDDLFEQERTKRTEKNRCLNAPTGIAEVQ